MNPVVGGRGYDGERRRRLSRENIMSRTGAENCWKTSIQKEKKSNAEVFFREPQIYHMYPSKRSGTWLHTISLMALLSQDFL